MEEATPIEILKQLTEDESIVTIPPELKEKYPTLHFCYEFDGLAIDKFCPEWDYCSCL